MKNINLKKVKIYSSVIALGTSVVLIHSGVLNLVQASEKKEMDNTSSKEILSNEVKSNKMNRICISMNDGIYKVSVEDLTTRKNIEGAVLSLKDTNNNIIEEWVSTEEPYYITNLVEGEYTIIEQKAPEGYEKITEDIKFNVNNNSKTEVITKLR